MYLGQKNDFELFALWAHIFVTWTGSYIGGGKIDWVVSFGLRYPKWKKMKKKYEYYNWNETIEIRLKFPENSKLKPKTGKKRRTRTTVKTKPSAIILTFQLFRTLWARQKKKQKTKEENQLIIGRLFDNTKSKDFHV